MSKNYSEEEARVTKEQVAVFAGIDNKVDVYSSEYLMIHELLDTIVLIANGEYKPGELKEDIFDSEFNLEEE